MRRQQYSEQELPVALREYVQALKADDRPLSAEVASRLASARQRAVQRHAEQASVSRPLSETLSWLSFGHPRMLGAAAMSVCVLIGGVLLTMQHDEDAMLLGEDLLPVEAFVDNGFEAWQYTEHI